MKERIRGAVSVAVLIATISRVGNAMAGHVTWEPLKTTVALLDFLDTFVGQVIATLTVVIVVYVALSLAFRRMANRTRHEMLGVFVSYLRWPLPLILALLGFAIALDRTGLPTVAIVIADGLVRGCIVIIVAALSMRLLLGPIARRAKIYASQSESNLYEMLFPPLIGRVIPLGIFLVTLATVLWAIGIDLGSALIALAALSFLLLLFFQEPLSNLFSGMYLVTDVPFKYGDLVTLEDEKTYRVEEIGARVTKLYSVDDHSLAYMPNNKLAGQRLINLTRPNVELRMKIPIGVAYGTKDLAQAQELLRQAADAHPHVLGDLDTKLKAMSAALQSISNENERQRLKMEMERLGAEHAVRDLCDNLIRQFQFLKLFVRHLKTGGLDPRKRERIREIIGEMSHSVDDMIRKLTAWLHLVGRLETTYRWDGPITPLTAHEIDRWLPEISEMERWRKDGTDPDQIRSNCVSKGYLAPIGTFADVDDEFFMASSASWLEFSKELHSQGIDAALSKSLPTWMREQPTWDNFNEYYMLYKNWHKPVRDLLRMLEECRTVERLHGEKQFHLDDLIGKIVSLLEQRFLLRVPGWQKPDADFAGYGASSIDFRLEFFVDDLVRDHFQRLDDVFSEVGLAVWEMFKKEGIEIPFPQMDVWFRDKWWSVEKR